MIVYRASSLGSCVRALVAQRRGEPENETPSLVQSWYDRGIAHEDECVAAMAQDWLVTDQQAETETHIAPDVVVRGHLDGICQDESGSNRVLEIKSPPSWAKWRDAHLRGDYSDPLMSRYAWQISAYMAATGLEAVVACVDDGTVKTFGIEVAPYTVEDIRKRVLSVEFMVETGVWPECTSRDFPCPFFPRQCTHAVEEVAFDPIADSYAAAYMTAKREEKARRDEAEEARAKLLAHLDERDTVTTDTYKVTRYATTRTNRDFKAIKAAGIDLAPYETTTESVSLRVTEREQ